MPRGSGGGSDRAPGPPFGAPERRTDLGNAKRMAWQHRDALRYAATIGWLEWDGCRWRSDDTLAVQRRAKETARRLLDEAYRCEDEEREKVVKFAMKSESAASIEAMIKLAKSERPLAVRASDFDCDPWVFNCSNATLDLRTTELRAHDPRDMITRVAGCAYDPAAECPRWDAFLARVLNGDEGMIAFVRRAVGYTLFGSRPEQVLMICHGTGANGKSTFLETLRHVFGDYAMATDFSSLAPRRNEGPRNDLARLRGARLVTAVEAGAGRAFDEVIVKQLTGGDAIATRFLYHEYFEFQPQFQFFVAANHKPVVKGTDEAIWRRLVLIPFDVTIPPAERDGGLRDALTTEAEGILAWAVRGFREWSEAGLQPPERVRVATSGYRQDMDPLEGFFETRVHRSATARERTSVLFDAYKAWAQNSGEVPLTIRAFGDCLSEKGYGSIKSGGVKFRLGLRLASASRPEGGEGREDGSPVRETPPQGGTHQVPEMESQSSPTSSAVTSGSTVEEEAVHVPF